MTASMMSSVWMLAGVRDPWCRLVLVQVSSVPQHSSSKSSRNDLPSPNQRLISLQLTLPTDQEHYTHTQVYHMSLKYVYNMYIKILLFGEFTVSLTHTIYIWARKAAVILFSPQRRKLYSFTLVSNDDFCTLTHFKK